MNTVRFTTEEQPASETLVPQPSERHTQSSSPNACSPIVDETPSITTTNRIPNLDNQISNTESSPQTTNQLDTRNSIVVDSDSANGENSNSDSAVNVHDRKRRSISSYSQKVRRVSTTMRPRTRYDDEGKWRIIRQNEKKQKKNYQYSYV